MRQLIALALAVLLGGNGLFMLAMPFTWYLAVPGVSETGPLNGHFVRDIGCAYLVAGSAAVWVGLDRRAWPAALASGGFLALHAALHLAEMLGGHGLGHLATDLPAVFLPAALLLWLGWPPDHRLSRRDHAEMADPAAARRL